MTARHARLAWILAASLFASAATAAPVLVFSTDFNSGIPPQVTGAGFLESVGGYPAPFSGDFLRNDTGGAPYGNGPAGTPTVLTLTGLPPHTSVDVRFLLAVLDSWDSDNGNPSPDWFHVVVDGVNQFTGTWAVQSGSNNTLPDFGMGYFAANPGFADKAVDMTNLPSLTSIPHTASTLEVRWYADGAGWQGSTLGADESWAIDNVQVYVDEQATPAGRTTWGRLKAAYR